MHPEPLPEPLEGRGFTTAHARTVGVSAERLRRSDLQHPFHGLHAPAAHEMSARDLIALRSLSVPDGHWFSHTSAAVLHGLWLPERLTADPTVHLSCVDPSRRRAGRGTQGHAVRPGTDVVQRVRGLPVQSPADVWASLAGELDALERVQLGDSLLRRQHPHSRLEDLRGACERRRGRRHSRALVAALEDVRAGTDSVKETELRLLLTSWGFPEPQVNLPIVDAAGDLVAIGDLVWEEYRVVCEYDGDQHRTDRRQYERDLDRLEHLGWEGWRVVRAQQRHLRAERHTLRRRVARALLAGGYRPDLTRRA
ncbi:DUF559 domain-containing protein [Auraticoccus monumenti]|uniref:DUF559 domain-containing protein n=1 Tax=Auraticoccus monumenti TaxID=675864 RepID=A0A1G6RLD7_9ACTN|nr:DUF559 domain-containing protein [Auraticoccus monumenti]SDD04767.1 Protein of unknown function [Auraticoccus monumenti]